MFYYVMPLNTKLLRAALYFLSKDYEILISDPPKTPHPTMVCAIHDIILL